MTPSDQFVADAQASCDAQLAARSKLLERFIRERVATDDPGVSDLAFAAFRDAVADDVMRKLLEGLATFPDDFPERSAMCVLDGFIGGLNDEILGGIADDAIHPTIDKLH